MQMPKSIKHNQAGQTLVEVIIAIAVLALAMGSAGSLAATSTRVTTESGRRTQATALASREAEALRSLRDRLAESTAPPRTLFQYFNSSGADVDSNGSGCYSFVMAEDGSHATGWRTESTGGYNAPLSYGTSDFNFGGGGGNTSIEGVENYKRVVRACRSRDFVADSGYTGSEYLFDIEVRVYWAESGGPDRQLIYRTMLSTPKGASHD